jgi:glutaredoxin
MITLYSKAECGLCEEAEVVLRKLQREIQFSLEVVDIESDKRLFDRYWARVPVVVVDGKEVAEAPIEARRLRALIAS